MKNIKDLGSDKDSLYSADIEELDKIFASNFLSYEQSDGVLGKRIFDEILKGTKQRYKSGDYKILTQDINAYLRKSDANKGKLYHYCESIRHSTNHVPSAMRYMMAEIKINKNFNQVGYGDNDLEGIKKFINEHEHDATLAETVLKLMEQKGLKAPQVYNRGMMSRQEFSRVINLKTNYVISRSTVWSVIFGLGCTLEEADVVLYSAGYARQNTQYDMIMEYFLNRKIYNIMRINMALNAYEYKSLSVYKNVKDSDPFKD